LALVLLAPVARAQDYKWTDANGVVHFASDPSEVPGPYRQKAVSDALKREQATKAAPTAPAAPAPESDAPRQFTDPRQITPEQTQRKVQSGRIEREADQEAAKAASRRREAEKEDEKEQKRDAKRERDEEAQAQGHAVVPEGFHKECLNQFDKSGLQICHLVEDQDRSGDRMDAAREKAKDELGVTDEEAAKDPELRKQLDKRVMKEYNRTTPNPYKQGDGDEDEPSGDEE
jgi:hypothetical protein